jgi:hypothetical protein
MRSADAAPPWAAQKYALRACRKGQEAKTRQIQAQVSVQWPRRSPPELNSNVNGTLKQGTPAGGEYCHAATTRSILIMLVNVETQFPYPPSGVIAARKEFERQRRADSRRELRQWQEEQAEYQRHWQQRGRQPGKESHAVPLAPYLQHFLELGKTAAAVREKP